MTVKYKDCFLHLNECECFAAFIVENYAKSAATVRTMKHNTNALWALITLLMMGQFWLRVKLNNRLGVGGSLCRLRLRIRCCQSIYGLVYNAEKQKLREHCVLPTDLPPSFIYTAGII